MEMLPPNSDRVASELIAQGSQTAVLGVYVTEQSGARETFALMHGVLPDGPLQVGGWVITPVSVQSPIGQRLQQAQVAEQVMIRTPDGETYLEIVSVDGCPVISPQECLRIRKRREEEREALLTARWMAEQEAHQRRVQQQQEQSTIAELQRRRKQRDREWREQIR